MGGVSWYFLSVKFSTAKLAHLQFWNEQKLLTLHKTSVKTSYFITFVASSSFNVLYLQEISQVRLSGGTDK